MDRFKFTELSIKKAIQFLKNKKGKPSAWVTKFKDDLSVKGGKIFFKDREVVPREKVSDLLRNELYKKNGDIPSGRDSAFHLLKQRYIGCSRRAVMEFIRSQKPLGEIKAALNKPKQSSGEKLKNYVFETDLIFLKKNDLENANKKFIRDEIPSLSYFLSTVEKVTGLCRIEYVLNKEAAVVTPKVIKQCKEMAKLLNTTTKKCDIRMDRGGEFSLKDLSKHFKEAKHVNSGVSVENKNSQFQANFFKIIRQRKAVTIDDAMKQAQKLLNNTYNRIHKKTSNELVDRSDEKEDLKEYNTKRKSFIAGDKRNPFEVGQYVRILIKDKKPGIDYKKYKNKTYSQAVYIIKKTTKKAVPRKYYVKGKWWLQSDLLKSAPRDEKSIQLVKERDEEFKNKRKKERQEHEKNRLQQIKEEEDLKRKAEKEKRTPPKKRPYRYAGHGAKVGMVFDMADSDKLEDKLDAIEEEADEVQIKKEKAQLQASKKKLKESESAERKKLVKYLKSKNLPTGGNIKFLKKRIRVYKRELKKKLRTV